MTAWNPLPTPSTDPEQPDVWGMTLNAAIDQIRNRFNLVCIAVRQLDGTWPDRPSGANGVLWFDLTGLPPSDPPQFNIETDIIVDPGVA